MVGLICWGSLQNSTLQAGRTQLDWELPKEGEQCLTPDPLEPMPGFFPDTESLRPDPGLLPDVLFPL